MKTVELIKPRPKNNKLYEIKTLSNISILAELDDGKGAINLYYRGGKMEAYHPFYSTDELYTEPCHIYSHLRPCTNATPQIELLSLANNLIARYPQTKETIEYLLSTHHSNTYTNGLILNNNNDNVSTLTTPLGVDVCLIVTKPVANFISDFYQECCNFILYLSLDIYEVMMIDKKYGRDINSYPPYQLLIKLKDNTARSLFLNFYELIITNQYNNELF